MDFGKGLYVCPYIYLPGIYKDTAGTRSPPVMFMQLVKLINTRNNILSLI